MNDVCEHGGLRRKCEICERDDRITELEAELKETKDYCNALLRLAKDFMPSCPAKRQKMWEKALERGRKFSSNVAAERDKLKKDLANALAAIEAHKEEVKT